MNPCKIPQEEKIARWQARLDAMDARGTHEITVPGAFGTTETYTRREVLNLLSALRGEPKIEWAVPETEDREHACKYGGKGIRYRPEQSSQKPYEVMVWMNGERYVLGSFPTRSDACDAIVRFRWKHRGHFMALTTCANGHLMTKDVVSKGKNSHPIRCRLCHAAASRKYRLEKKQVQRMRRAA